MDIFTSIDPVTHELCSSAEAMEGVVNYLVMETAKGTGDIEELKIA